MNTTNKISPILIDYNNKKPVARILRKCMSIILFPVNKLFERQQKYNIHIDETVKHLKEKLEQIMDMYDYVKKEINKHKVDNFDYVGFEKWFRGNEADTKSKQVQYIKFFEKKGKVLDIGCGRGEFLQLLQENGFQPFGVDLNEDMVNEAKSHGFDIKHEDAIHFLSDTEEKFDGIFSAQVVEHLRYPEIIEMISLCFQHMNSGGTLVLETLNVKTLFPHLNSFYMDPSHVQFIAPETLKFICQNAGFETVDIVFTNPTPDPLKLQLDPTQSDIYNKNIQILNETIFGYLDYAIVAKKS